MIVESPVTMPREETQRIMFGISDWDKKCHFSLKDEVYLYEKMNFKVDSWFIDMEEPNWRKKYQPSEQVLDCLKALRKEDDIPEENTSSNASSTSNGNTWEAVFKAIAKPGALKDPVKMIFQNSKTVNEPITAGTVIGIDSVIDCPSLSVDNLILFNTTIRASAIAAKRIAISGGSMMSTLVRTAFLLADNNEIITDNKILGKDMNGKRIFSASLNIPSSESIKGFLDTMQKYLEKTSKGNQADVLNKNLNTSSVSLKIGVLSNYSETDILSGIDDSNIDRKLRVDDTKYQQAMDLIAVPAALDKMDPSIKQWVYDQLKAIAHDFAQAGNNKRFLDSLQGLFDNPINVNELPSLIKVAEALANGKQPQVTTTVATAMSVADIKKYLTDNEQKVVDNDTLPTHNKQVGSVGYIKDLCKSIDPNLIINNQACFMSILALSPALCNAIAAHIAKERTCLK